MTYQLQPLIDRIPAEQGWLPSISVPAEWHPVLLQLDRDLAAIDPNYIIHQVKIKFGSLRYYAIITTTTRSDEFHALIHQAERLCEDLI